MCVVRPPQVSSHPNSFDRILLWFAVVDLFQCHIQKKRGISYLEHLCDGLAPGCVVRPHKVVSLLVPYHVVRQVQVLHREVRRQRLDGSFVAIKSNAVG